MAARQTLTSQDRKKRIDAYQLLHQFRDFLYAQDHLANKRRALTPASALGHLKNEDVCELLPRGYRDSVQKAAELLI